MDLRAWDGIIITTMMTAAGAPEYNESTCYIVTQPGSSWHLETSVTRLKWLQSWHSYDPCLPVVKKLSGLGTSETMTPALRLLSYCLKHVTARDTCDKWLGHCSWHGHDTVTCHAHDNMTLTPPWTPGQGGHPVTPVTVSGQTRSDRTQGVSSQPIRGLGGDQATNQRSGKGLVTRDPDWTKVNW